MPQEWCRPAFEKALDKLRELGAEVVEIDIENCEVLTEDDDTVMAAMNCEFKSHIKEYLETLEKSGWLPHYKKNETLMRFVLQPASERLGWHS